MVCHQCGRAVQPGDRFCTGCGASLEDATDTTEVLATTPSGDATTPETDTTPEHGTPAATPTSSPTSPTPVSPVSPVSTTPQASPVSEPLPTEPVPIQASRPTAAPEPDGEAPAIVDDDAGWGEADPVWAATGSMPAQGVTTGDLPSTEPITEVWMDSVEAETTTPTETPPPAADAPPTGPIAATPTATAEMPAVVAPPPARQRFRFGAVTLIGIGTGIVTLVSLFANVLSVTSDTRLDPTGDVPFGFRTGTWIVDDLADNLAIAGLLAVLMMVVGGIAAGFHWHWGAGLAGGAGLAFAGVSALTIGLAQIPIDAAHEFARIPTEEPFTLTITRDLGYWMLLVAGALGVVLFFAAINDALDDRRPGLNPWIAALGALAGVVAAAGPLIPESLAVFSDNWYVVDAPGEPPAMLLVTRLVQLAMLAITGTVGFLSVRRWGLGVAVGGALPAIWLAVSVLFELGDNPVGPGFRNPGATDMHLHGVTIIGVSAVAAMAVLAVISAYDQGVRERR
ncbi:MAG: zinc ribbon domain-containing protein [Ilumatobacter sp.]|uniref:zinc ribbon domain-containing protein n=1 Tax=Ilumatobacter sp. TaxID=1967498 RepID=UPI002623A7A0|nr:zinc ribbon domain-containing protein [Ilumatobacter sp.]MDJ0767621.1 zinc ribbon domain-containing protein [Ilumatobacter sp.]